LLVGDGVFGVGNDGAVYATNLKPSIGSSIGSFYLQEADLGVGLIGMKGDGEGGRVASGIELTPQMIRLKTTDNQLIVSDTLTLGSDASLNYMLAERNFRIAARDMTAGIELHKKSGSSTTYYVKAKLGAEHAD